MTILQSLPADPDAFTTLLTEKHDVGKVDSPFPLYNATLLLGTCRLLVSFNEIHFLHDNPVLISEDAEHFALFTLFLASRYDNDIVPFDSYPSHGILLEDLGSE